MSLEEVTKIRAHLGRERGTGTNCRNGPSGALHNWIPSPFPVTEHVIT